MCAHFKAVIVLWYWYKLTLIGPKRNHTENKNYQASKRRRLALIKKEVCVEVVEAGSFRRVLPPPPAASAGVVRGAELRVWRCYGRLGHTGAGPQPLQLVASSAAAVWCLISPRYTTAPPPSGILHGGAHLRQQQVIALLFCVRAGRWSLFPALQVSQCWVWCHYSWRCQAEVHLVIPKWPRVFWTQGCKVARCLLVLYMLFWHWLLYCHELSSERLC